MLDLFQNLIAILNGRRDGKKNLPEGYQKKSPYLRKIKEEGSSTINTINRKWQKKDDSLKTTWLKSLENEYFAKNKLYEAEEDYENAKDEYFSYNPGEKSIPKRMKLKFILYYFTLTFFVFADMYLTIVAIRIFGEAEIFNIIFGFVLGIILAVFCHKFGEKLAESGKSYNKHFLITGISLVILVAVMIGVLRGLYLSHSSFINFATIMYSVLNLFFLYGGLLYSYNIHQPGMFKLYISENAKIKSDNKHSTALQYRLQSATKREKEFNYFKSLANSVINRVNHLMHIYWTYNLIHRTDDCSEDYSPDPIIIPLPKTLESLDWSIPNQLNNQNNNFNNNEKNYETNGHAQSDLFVNYSY